MVEHEERSGGFAVGGARLFARVPNTHLVPKAHGFFFILFFPLGKRKTSHPKQNQKKRNALQKRLWTYMYL